MCIVLFSYKVHPKYKLIITSNRDEFYKRPTMQAEFWEDNPNILAGRDLEKGGTWLGITKQGRFATLTNYRDPSSMNKNGNSRGHLVSTYLESNIPPRDYLEQIQSSKISYNGFNLLVGDQSELFYYSRQNNEITKIEPGIHGLSNHSLNTPWPKVILGTTMLKDAMADKFSHHKLFNILKNNSIAKDEDLPDTKVGIELERLLSPIFIESPQYGTRAMTVITVDYNDEVTFIEKALDTETKQWNESFFCFKVQKAL